MDRDYSRKMIRGILRIFVYLLPSWALLGGTSVWKVDFGNTSVYFGGTIHLRDLDYPLPHEFEAAYEASSKLVFEVDISRIGDPYRAKLLQQSAMLPEDDSLSEMLSPGVYSGLARFWRRAGLPPEVMSRYKPAFVLGALQKQEFQLLEIEPDGTDLNFYMRGRTDGKKMDSLETVEEQVSFVLSIAEGEEDEYVLHSLQELSKIHHTYEALVAGWRRGDMTFLDNHFLRAMREDFPGLYKKLLMDRNSQWLQAILPFFKTREREFVLIGVAHLVGEDGILKKLSDLGYRVHQLEATPGQGVLEDTGHSPVIDIAGRPLEKVDFKIIPLAGFPEGLATRLERDLEEELGLDGEVTLPMPLSQKMYALERRQLVTNRIATEAVRAFRDATSSKDSPFTMVLTHYDINQPPFQSPFVFSSNFDKVSVISSSRMDPRVYGKPYHPDLVYLRLKKMAKQGLGKGYYGYPYTKERHSVMYSPIQGIGALDKMGMNYPLDQHSVLNFFNHYRLLSAQFSEELANLYADHAKVISKWGTEEKGIDMEVHTGRQYKAQLPNLLKAANSKRDTHRYSLIQVDLQGMTARISAERYSELDGFTDKDYHMVVSRTAAGGITIIEEQRGTQPDKHAFATAGESLRQLMEAQEQAFGKVLPMTLGNGIRLDTVEVAGDTMVYHQTLLQAGKGQLDTETAHALYNDAVVKYARENPSLRKILKLGGSLAYVYRYPDGTPITVIRVDSGQLDE